MRTPSVPLEPRAVVRVLAGIAACLVLVGTVGQCTRFLLGHDNLMGVVPLFDLDDERSIPTIFSVLLLAFCSLLLFVIGVLAARQSQPHRWHWAILSLGFMFMAFDEALSFHEMLIEPTGAVVGSAARGIFHFAWVIPAFALLIPLAAFFFRFLHHLAPRIRRRFLLAATLYLGGAIGIELAGGYCFEAHGPCLTYSLLVAVEESLEMAGLIAFIGALLAHLGEEYDAVRFTLARRRG